MSVPYDVEQEIANLLAVKDHHPKLVVTPKDFLLNRSYSSILPDLR